MRVHRYEDVTRFAADVGGFLLAHEAEHNLLLGILEALQEDDGPYAGVEPCLALVRDDAGQATLVAIRTPPRNLLLSLATTEEALRPLLANLRQTAPDLPGVTGPRDLAAMFARGWADLTGQAFVRHVSMRVFKADRVRHPKGVPGRLREATSADRGMAVDWGGAFELEALGEQPDGSERERWADQMLGEHANRGLVFWEVDGEVVSMAGYGGPTPNGIRVFAVYTPSELRQRGYATACVAALTERLLQAGRTFCFLSTDLANPTSNAIYQWIGYRPVMDVDDYRSTGPRDRAVPTGRTGPAGGPVRQLPTPSVAWPAVRTPDQRDTSASRSSGSTGADCS